MDRTAGASPATRPPFSTSVPGRLTGSSAAAPGRRSRSTELGHTVTIVGSRRASSYGLGVAEELGRLLAAAGLVVVSGMARGIDAAAHRGALIAGGTTVAVLGGGADVVYPASARRLYRDIVAKGAAISEAPPGQRPEPGAFPKRNRLMAALGAITVVVEAAQPSGSLITARQALGPGSRGRRDPRPGHLEGVRGDQRAARRRGGADPRSPGRSRPAARGRGGGGSSAAGLRSIRTWRGRPRRSSWEAAPATPSPSPWALGLRRRRWRSRASSCSATCRSTPPAGTRAARWSRLPARRQHGNTLRG